MINILYILVLCAIYFDLQGGGILDTTCVKGYLEQIVSITPITNSACVREEVNALNSFFDYILCHDRSGLASVMALEKLNSDIQPISTSHFNTHGIEMAPVGTHFTSVYAFNRAEPSLPHFGTNTAFGMGGLIIFILNSASTMPLAQNIIFEASFSNIIVQTLV